MPAIIRDATETDLPGIRTIYNEVVRTSAAVYTEQEATLEDRKTWFAQRTALAYPVLVAEDPASGAVLGFATFGDFRPWPGYRHTVEHSVYIRADARGRGLGKALVEPLFERAASIGKHVMVAAIDAANPASIRLHERLGFERIGTLREVGTKFGRWLDLVFMQRFLDQPSAQDIDMDARPPPPAHAPIGHNGGPPLEQPDPNASWRLWCWRRAHKKAWSAPREIALSRLARAEALGMTYREYTLEIMERGRYL